MTKTYLHITNGDSAARIMSDAGIPGRILPWRDILHDGPLPAGLSLEELAEIRARFFAQPPVASCEEILEDIRERDRTLARFRDYDKVVLWLEHDLVDQLQLLQLLHWFSGKDQARMPLGLICINHFPGVEPFYGLGQLDTTQMASLQGSELEITGRQLELGRRGWLAFTAETPGALSAFIREDLSPLPYLSAALIRHMEEFPDLNTGLSRHERQILEMAEAGIQRPGRMFAEQQKREAAPYLGDWGFWSLIEQLANVPNALLQTRSGAAFRRPPDVPADEAFRSQTLELTEQGRSVLRGGADWLKLNPPDKWKGGVHLHPKKLTWRWDAGARTLVETA